MYTHEIREMAEAIAAKTIAPVDDIEAVLKEYWTDKIALTWSEGDMQVMAMEEGRYLNRKERQEALQLVMRKCDANVGVSFASLGEASREFGRELTGAEIAEIGGLSYYPWEVGEE